MSVIYRYLSESVRWLLIKGKKHEAETILRKIAAANKTYLEPNIMDKLKSEGGGTGGKKYSLLDLLRTWSIAKISLNVWFLWYVTRLSRCLF